MADTSELPHGERRKSDLRRRLFDAIHDIEQCDGSWANRYWTNRVVEAIWPLVTAQSRLQAEAPEDAEVAEIEKRHRKYAEQNTCAGVVGFAPGAGAPFYEDVATLLAKLRALQSRTSQAEAQAPAVLTPDSDLAKMVERERARLGWRSGHITDAEAEYMAGIRREPEEGEAFLLEIIDRLSPPSTQEG